MDLLLDTHTFLWYIDGDPHLSAKAHAQISNPNNHLLLSMASLWEIAIKIGVGKLSLSQPLPMLVATELQYYHVDVLAIANAHVVRVATLPPHHRDPFDRMLVAQCQVENLPLVSRDPAFDAYGIQRLW